MAEPTITTIKRLFALSSNRCAFPGCTNQLIDPSGPLIGRVCHICADKPGGKRYDPSQTDVERQGFSNLILLCANHHIVVDDDEAKYTVAVLHDMKQRHEASSDRAFVISDATARRIVLLMTGGVAGAGLVELIRGFGHFARALGSALSPPADPKDTSDDRGEKLLKELDEILRYGPKGVMTYHSSDPNLRQVGAFFEAVFKRSGWRSFLDEGLPALPGRDRGDGGPFLQMFFQVDEHQLSNAKQTTEQVFRRCGFTPFETIGGSKYASNKDAIRIVIYFGPLRR